MPGQRKNDSWEEMRQVYKARAVFEREWEARLLSQAGARS